MDSDRKVSFAKFETVVGVFRRPDIDSKRDGGDQNENDAEFGESLHGETPLFEMVIFAPGLAAFVSGLSYLALAPERTRKAGKLSDNNWPFIIAAIRDRICAHEIASSGPGSPEPGINSVRPF